MENVHVMLSNVAQPTVRRGEVKSAEADLSLSGSRQQILNQFYSCTVREPRAAIREFPGGKLTARRVRCAT